MPNPSPIRSACLALLLLGAAAVPTGAQEEGGRASREREALRRTQAALRAAQEQQSTLEREKATLAAQAAALEESARRAQTELSGARLDATREHAELVRLRAELESLRAKGDAERRSGESREAEAAQRLAESTQRQGAADRLLAQRTATVTSLVALQERTYQALVKAEGQNRDLYAFGRQLIDQVRAGTSGDAFAVSEPVLAFGRVRLENQAEALRDRLDALRLGASPK